MAGGIWKSQNKVRPGAYINFKAVAASSSRLGDRGIMTMPVAMSWGPQKQVVELLSTDLLDGNSLKKIGYGATDPEAQVFIQALSNCYKALVYRLDVGGAKATADIGSLLVTAKYYGVVGNDISVGIAENNIDSNLLDVVTYYRNSEQDRQTVAKTGSINDLQDNDWVDFSGTGSLTAAATTALKGGTNGTVSAETYTADDGYLKAVAALKWNVMAIPQTVDIATEAVKNAIIAQIRTLREDEGKRVQAVLYNVDTNYEGIITTEQGYRTVNETISPEVFVAYVAGLTAGSNVATSNTYRVIDGAVEIVYPEGVAPYTHSEVVTKLQSGKFILTTRQDGAVVVEQDINTLHTPYPSADVNYSFTKNRVIRTLDDINNQVATLFETGYIGKVSNNENGRAVFKADVINYLNLLQGAEAIAAFDPATDITVEAGTDIDSVVVTLAIRPVDSMEKLYMTINVG